MKTITNTTTSLDIVFFAEGDEEGFGKQEGFYILEYNKDDFHVIWESQPFSTKEEAEKVLFYIK